MKTVLILTALTVFSLADDKDLNWDLFYNATLKFAEYEKRIEKLEAQIEVNTLIIKKMNNLTLKHDSIFQELRLWSVGVSN